MPDVAGRAFVARGFHVVSMDEIAEAAGSPGRGTRIGRLKHEWALLPLRVRGLERVQLHAA